MVNPSPSDVIFAGQRLKRKVLLALALSGVLPLLVLTYVMYGYILPHFHAGDSNLLAVEVLILSTALAMIGGAWVIWDLGRVMARLARMLSEHRSISDFEDRRDDIGTLMRSFNQMLGTIELQAKELNTFGARLESAQKELELTTARLKDASFKDEVTGLYNRRFFSLRLEEELSRHRRFKHPISVVELDVDEFKAINDELGHAAGDTALREIADILLKHSRGINVISRYGGDEFAILLVETTKSGACLYAERLREVMSTHPFDHGRALTASFGVASLPEDEVLTAEDLFRAADEALYSAKRTGKNRVVAAEPPDKAPAAADSTEQVAPLG